MNNFFNTFLPLARIARNRKIIPLISLFQHDKILDTSCGDGNFLKTLYKNNNEKSCEYYGIDFDAEIIEKAKKSFEFGNFSVSGNDSLEYGGEIFDCVISTMTLHHMSDVKKSLLEMRRVCKQEGRIVLVDSISFSKFSRFVLKVTGKCPEPYHFEKFYSDTELETIFSELKLRVAKKKTFYVFPGLGICMPVVFFELKKIV